MLWESPVAAAAVGDSRSGGDGPGGHLGVAGRSWRGERLPNRWTSSTRGGGLGLGVAGRVWRGERLPNGRRELWSSGDRERAAACFGDGADLVQRGLRPQRCLPAEVQDLPALRGRGQVPVFVELYRARAPKWNSRLWPSMPSNSSGMARSTRRHERPVVGPDLVLAHDGRQLGARQRQLEEALEPGVGHSLLPLGRVEQAKEHPGATRPGPRKRSAVMRSQRRLLPRRRTSSRARCTTLASCRSPRSTRVRASPVQRMPSTSVQSSNGSLARRCTTAPDFLSVPRRGIVTSSGPSANPSRPWSAAAAAPLMTPVPVPASSSTFSFCRHVAGAPTMVSTPGRGSRILLVTFQRKIWSASTSTRAACRRLKAPCCEAASAATAPKASSARMG